jgi:hypothetical protein
VFVPGKLFSGGEFLDLLVLPDQGESLPCDFHSPIVIKSLSQFVQLFLAASLITSKLFVCSGLN